MLSLIIAFAISIATFFSINAAWPGHYGWTSFFGVLALLAVWILINFKINKILEKIFKNVQELIGDGQDKLRRKITMYQQKGIAGPRIQEKIEEELKGSIREAIKLLDAVDPLRKWNWLAGRQADTMKAQLLYQIKDYESADPLIEKALAFDPMIVAMKMARYYKRDMNDKMLKTYKTGIKRFKGDKKVLIYALYSWILVKQGKVEEAVVVLNEASLKTDSPVIKENWEHLANGRLKRFSNAGLGDQWFALNLEDQKQVRIRQQASPFGGAPGRFR